MNKNKLHTTYCFILIASILMLLLNGCSSDHTDSLNTPEERLKSIHSEITDIKAKLGALIDSNDEARKKLEEGEFLQELNYLEELTHQLESIKKGYKPEYCGFKPWWIKYKLYGYLTFKDFKTEQWNFFYDIERFQKPPFVTKYYVPHCPPLDTLNRQDFERNFNYCLNLALQSGHTLLEGSKRLPHILYMVPPEGTVERIFYEQSKKVYEARRQQIKEIISRLTRLQFKEK